MPFDVLKTCSETETSKSSSNCIFLVEVANELDIIISSEFTRSWKAKGFGILDLVIKLATIEIMVLIFNLFFQDWEVVHVTVNDDCSAIFHQETLVVEIVFKARVFNRADMVWADI